MDESNSKPEKPKNQRRFSQEQYDMLKSCSDKKDMTEWNQWFKKNHWRECIVLECADFCDAYLEGAFLWGVNLKEARLINANLECADFTEADLSKADLTYAHLKGTDFTRAELKMTDFEGAQLEGAWLDETDLRGAQFQWSSVDGATLIRNCNIDSITDFRDVALDNLRIDPANKQRLEHNIRRKNWEDWYPKQHRLLAWIVRKFWWISDYGISTKRIIFTFFGLALFFAVIYSNLACWLPPGIVSNLEIEPHLPLWHYLILLLLRPIYFSVVTMTTLGFGDMYANAQSIWGHILLTFQVILGYVLLGALVTRFAVLFTAGGPAGSFADDQHAKTVA